VEEEGGGSIEMAGWASGYRSSCGSLSLSSARSRLVDGASEWLEALAPCSGLISERSVQEPLCPTLKLALTPSARSPTQEDEHVRAAAAIQRTRSPPVTPAHAHAHRAHALHARSAAGKWPCSPSMRPARTDDAAKCCPTVAGTVLRCDQDRASRLAYAPKQGIPLLKLRSRAGHTIDTAIAHHPQITVFLSIRHPLTHYMQSHGRDGPRHRTNLTRTLVLPFPSPRRARLSLVLPHALESKAEQSSVPLRNEKTVLSRARLP